MVSVPLAALLRHTHNASIPQHGEGNAWICIEQGTECLSKTNQSRKCCLRPRLKPPPSPPPGPPLPGSEETVDVPVSVDAE